MSEKPKWTNLQERRHCEDRDHNDDSDGSWVGGLLFIALIVVFLSLCWLNSRQGV